MSLAVRRLLVVVVGAVIAVYGVASLTGGWLGTPPWWPKNERAYSWFLLHPTHLGDGHEWIGLGLATVGLALMLAAWPRQQRPRVPPHRILAGPPRAVALILGSVLTMYAVASLTGTWLGEPPWWRTRTAPAEWQEFWARQRLWMRRPVLAPDVVRERSKAIEEERARLIKDRPGDPVVRVDGLAYVRPGREWISGGVVAAGLALVAVSAWPRRRAHAAF